MKMCLNGHEWAKRQLSKRGIGYDAERDRGVRFGHERRIIANRVS